jgi:hypothetical protein
MAKYRVSIIYTMESIFVVDAKNEEEAEELATTKLPRNIGSVDDVTVEKA